MASRGRTLGGSIKEAMQQQGHQSWGFVIYRCTYGDETKWSRFMAQFKSNAQELLSLEGNADMMDSLLWTICDDKDAFANASKDDLRKHFLSWANQSSDAKAEQPGARMAIWMPSREEVTSLSTPRYNYFIQVDDAAVEAVLTAEGNYDDPGYVNIVDAKWRLPTREDYDLEEDEEMEEGEEIKGCTAMNLGWQKVSAVNVYPQFYHDCESSWRLWSEGQDYIRPPRIALGW
jgi:hypothetical protein